MSDIPSYQYLGNSLLSINDQFQQLNISTCNLLYSSSNWSSLSETLNNISDRLNETFSVVSEISGRWKSSSDIVANLSKYWLQPIMVVYPTSFNVAVDVETVATWINAQNLYSLNPINFYEDQLIRVECITKNYNSQSLVGQAYFKKLLSTGVVSGSAASIDQILVQRDEKVSEYGVANHQVQNYLSLKNQIDLIISAINSRTSKYKIAAITDVAGLREIKNYITFSSIRGTFSSTEWSSISQIDLKQLYSLIDQFKTIDRIFAPLEIIVSEISEEDLLYFDIGNVYNNIVHALYFKRVGTSWVYWPDPLIDICLANNCVPCNDLIDVNGQYTVDRSCPNQASYLLIRCPENAVDDFPVPTLSSMITGNSIFSEYQGQFVDLNIGGDIAKYYISVADTISYPASSYLLPGTYTFIGESDYQSCISYGIEPLNISTPQIVDILSELFS